METHHGQTLERLIRRNGSSISELARIMKINRRSVYNWFKAKELKPELIYKISAALQRDLTPEFPDLFPTSPFASKSKSSVKDTYLGRSSMEDSANYWKDKYIELLEKHNELLITISKLP